MSKQYGLDVNPNAYIRDISVGMQQRVEILKTLYRGANVLIFDEPTAVLTPQEIDELMIILKELTDEGKSIILITHKLDEIKKSGGPLYGHSPGAKYWHRQCERRFFATVSRYDGGPFCFFQNREKTSATERNNSIN